MTSFHTEKCCRLVRPCSSFRQFPIYCIWYMDDETGWIRSTHTDLSSLYKCNNLYTSRPVCLSSCCCILDCSLQRTFNCPIIYKSALNMFTKSLLLVCWCLCVELEYNFIAVDNLLSLRRSDGRSVGGVDGWWYRMAELSDYTDSWSIALLFVAGRNSHQYCILFPPPSCSPHPTSPTVCLHVFFASSQHPSTRAYTAYNAFSQTSIYLSSLRLAYTSHNCTHAETHFSLIYIH